MSRLKLNAISSAAIGAGAIVLAGAGGYLAHAQGAGGAVNAPGNIASQATPGSFADIVARVAPAVVSINVVQRASASPAAELGQMPNPFGDDGQEGQQSPFPFFRFMIPPGASGA